MTNKGKSGSIKMPNNFEAYSEELFDKFLNEYHKKSLEILSYDSKPCKKKIYFAGPWFDVRSNKIYDCCKNIVKFFTKFYDVYFPREEINETPSEAFLKNVNNIKDCDIIIAVVSKKDTGTSWEIGMAYALNKSVYLLGYDETTFLSHTNAMLAFAGKCFTLKNLGKFLTNNMKEEDYVKIENDWEGIE